MRTILITAVLFASGCLIRTHSHSRAVVRSGPPACGPAHHLENGVCVHNGNGPVVRDHRH